MKKLQLHFSLFTLLFFVSSIVNAQIQQDSIVSDSLASLPYEFNALQSGSLYLSDFENYNIIYDPAQDRYLAVTTIGDYEVSFPIVMTHEEYRKYRLKKDMHDYFKGKIGATSKKDNKGEGEKDLLPKYYINSNFFESVFGGDEIEVNMQGNIELKMGVLHQKVDNPNLTERNRSTTIFDFDQNIGASILANVGKRVKISTNYDTKSTFDFQNIVKLEFDPSLGYDDDGIVKKIDVGNVSMPMRSSLIQGAQNLFGVKTELQFGKTTVSAVYAKQQSQSKTVRAEGGAIIEEFELQASDYDADRHFFLAQYFEDNFDGALENYPLISSSIQITNIEVWTTNTNQTTDNLRNIVAIADLAESISDNIGNIGIAINTPNPNFIPDNAVNELNSILTENGPIRNVGTLSNAFAGIATMAQGTDYSFLGNARRLLENTDFKLDRQLGYISLNRRLADSEVLAVAFEYTINGSQTVYKVGELSSDGIIAPKNLVVKLLRSELVNTEQPIWDLMMKNIYNLQAYQLNKDGFRFELLYENDETGVPLNALQTAQTAGVSSKTLLNLFYIDRLDQNDFAIAEGDGYFDFVEGVTIFSEKGYMMFPKVQPFGAYLEEEVLTDSGDANLIFNELYDYTQSEVKNTYQQKDKYQIRGYFKTDSASGISLGAFNVPQGSVHVTTGGRELVEGIDYVVDYQIGKVKIINPAIEASNAPIEVSVEQNAIFSQQRRSFMGVDVEHKFTENFVLGASYLRLNETPFSRKVSFGSEPIQNNIFGLNASYNTEAPFLTKMANRLPFMESDVSSNFSIRSDVAYLIPGTPSAIDIDGQAASYLDDFEGSQIPLNIRSHQQWYLASTPQGSTPDLGGTALDLDYGKKRARLSWYNIDYDLQGNQTIAGVDNDELSRAEVRRINHAELFPEDDQEYGIDAISIRTLDLAFFPNERGSYNYDTNNVNDDGTFSNPEDRWGGITRPLTITDFENSNIEYIQFWIMDPYKNYSITNSEGLPENIDPQNPINHIGDLYINLGNVSEDILRDNQKMYENGLPELGGTENTTNTIWGKIPNNQSMIYAFDDDDNHRIAQDIGLDGLKDSEENTKFADYINSLPAGAQAQAINDPSSDNFHFFKGADLDSQNAGILLRYKNFKRTQGNSNTISMSTESYPTTGTQYPDIEDINKDQTMSTAESYYQYKVSMNSSDLDVGTNNYIVDKRITTATLSNGNSQETTWYQVRIPIASGTAVNGISGFHSIRFMRMYMTGFRMPVVLRFAQMEMVRGEWRRYKYQLDNGTTLLDDTDNFESGVVNIQENDDRLPIPYVLPPGIDRERIQGATGTLQEQNEQSLSLKVRNLLPDEGRTIYKNISYDIRMFKRLQLFIHAENMVGMSESENISDDDLVAVIRIGSDLSDNFYQIEQPLKVTDFSTTTRDGIWPEANELNVDLDALKKLKIQRYEAGALANELYPLPQSGEPIAYKIRVKGHPNLGNIKTVMLGVKNRSLDSKYAEVWFNELRVSDFDNEGGWAAVVSADANIADLLDLAVTGRMSTKGYGNVDQSVNERSQEDIKQYDAVTNLNAGKFFPKNWGIQLPLNASIGEEIKDPKYDAQYQDIVLEDTNVNNSPHRNDAQDYTRRIGFSAINVKKNRNPESTKKQRFYDVENLMFSYAYNEMYHRDYNIKNHLDQDVRASAGYTYSFKPLEVTPFKKSKALKGKYFKLIKDFNFNFLPNDVSVNSNFFRTYNEQLSRSLVEGLPELPTLKQRNFLFDWDYGIGYKPTQAIRLNFHATNNHIYDDFTNADDVQLFQNFFNLGRPTHYHQALDASYQIPIDKIPLFSFIKSDYTYTADFDWQGASKSYVDQIANTVQNANTHNLAVDLNMKKFYKEVGLTKLLRTKSQRKRAKKSRKKTKKDKKSSRADGSDGTTKKSNQKIKKPKSTGGKLFRVFYNVLTSVKTVKASYQENNGTLLPGYKPAVGFLGRNNYSGGLAPNFGFVFGSQKEIRDQALEQGWLLSRNLHDPNNLSDDDPYYNKIYTRNHFEKIDLTAKVTPFTQFDININANRIYTKNLSEQMDVVFDNTNSSNRFNESIVSETGNFSMSYFMLSTAFDDSDVLFNQFKANRATIAQRLAAENGLDIAGYGTTSQQVILPAFLAAYSGQSSSAVKLNPFRDIPLPNWDIKYRGLMKLKWFKKRFKSVSVSHAYHSSYSILNFTNNLQYNASNPLETDISGNYFNEKLYSNIGLIEDFSPLVKVEIKLKNSLSFSARMNTDRMMTLNFNNNTLTQDKGTEYVAGFGYRFKDVPFTMKLKGNKMKFKGDVNLKLDVSLRDDEMMVRYFGEDNDINLDLDTGGQNVMGLQFLADYALNKNLQAGFYFMYDASKYIISTSYDRNSISSGISIKYNLGN